VPWYFSLHWTCIFINQDFGATSACPEKQSCPEIFCCMEYTFYTLEFWATCMRLPWKIEGALIFFTALNMYFLSIRIFEQLALALKNRGWLNSLNWMYFFLFRIFEQLALAMKNRGCPEIFCCIEYIFYYSGVLSNLRLPSKQSCPGIFHCIAYTFYIQNFWATCACPEKQREPWTYCFECIFFIIQDVWATCACPENRIALEFFTVLKYI